MRTRARLLGLPLLFCCACESKQREHALDAVLDGGTTVEAGADAATDDAGHVDRDPRDADLSDSETADGAPAPVQQDAAAPNSDAAALDAAVPDAGAIPDACVGDACAAESFCSALQPCVGPDDVCVQGTCQRDPAAPGASWLRSAWSGRAGAVHADDTTLWCTHALTQASAKQPAQVRGELQEIALHGARKERVLAPQASQRVRAQCFASAELNGASTPITSRWSSDAEQDQTATTCPTERPFAAFVRCQIATENELPLVFAGPSCGDGLAGLGGGANLQGQLLGDKYELSIPGKPLFNDTGPAAVTGTDLGFQFLAQGRMYLGFGDTWENDAQLPGPNGYRGSVLAYTHDFEPADSNGIAIEGWESAAEKPGIAREVIASPHDSSGASEFTAIPTAGFGLTEGATQLRVLWFASIKSWAPFVTNESTLAWSEGGQPFVRGDQQPSFHPPRWPFDSYFGPGAIWVDRLHGYVYFFGVRTYQPGNPVRLARVRATASAVRDHLQYEYWTGKEYRRPDPKDEYALARLPDPAADLIPGGANQNTRPELSISYNPYLDRYVLLIHNDATFLESEAQNYLQIWQAEQLEGPWTLADTGSHLVLPPNLYGPYHSEQTFSHGGQDIHFLLSDWNALPFVLGQPYVVGLWHLQLVRRVRSGCAP